MAADVFVSDHAVLRYLQRVDGPHPMDARGRIDVDAVRRIILADGRREAFAIGAQAIRIGEVVFRTRLDPKSDRPVRIVTTVIEEDQAHKRPHLSNVRKHKNGRANKHPRREER